MSVQPSDYMEEVRSKCAVLKVAPSVVAIVSRHVPDDMTVSGHPKRNAMRLTGDDSERAFGVSGLIVDCQKTQADDGDGDDVKYAALILTTATPFMRTNGVQPHDIKVDVYTDLDSYEGKVLACDFYSNLAIVKIMSQTPVPMAKLREIDDSISLSPSHDSSLLRPHSTLLKIKPGDPIIAVRRSYDKPFPIACFRGSYSLNGAAFGCKEFYCASSPRGYLKGCYGGAIINYEGEVIGLMLSDSCFLPTNLAQRWMKCFESTGGYPMPSIGFEVMDLHATSVDFLEQLTRKFPTISSGVLAMRVEQESHDSSDDSSVSFDGQLARTDMEVEVEQECDDSSDAIGHQDVILKCDGQVVRSTLEFFERVWDKAGSSVKLDVFRLSVGQRFEVTTVLGKAGPDDTCRWTLPYWFTRCEE